MNDQLKNFNKLCNLILEEFNKPIKYNDFPEGNDIDITNEIVHRHEIEKIILINHCINSGDIPPHGINYIDMSKKKFYQSIEMSISKMFNYFNDDYFKLFKYNFSFQILITLNSKHKTFRFCFDTIPTSHINSINMKLVTIFENDKNVKFSFDKHGNMKKQIILKKLIMENKNRINLPKIIL